MSPTSYQTAPPRKLIITNAFGIVKQLAQKSAARFYRQTRSHCLSEHGSLLLDCNGPYRIQRAVLCIELALQFCAQGFS